MNTDRSKVVILILVLLSCTCGQVLANSAIPGPLLVFGMYNSSIGVVWTISAMCMCVLVEGLIYHIFRLFPRPYLLSLIANTISLLAGFPLAIAGATVGDWMVTPTVLSIVTETLSVLLILRTMRAKWGSPTIRKPLAGVISANILSNIILFFMLGWVLNAYPRSDVAMFNCINNLRQIDSAKAQWALANHKVAGQDVVSSGVNDYLKGNTTPVCPAGGTYIYGAVGTLPICTYTNANTNLNHKLKGY